MIKVLNICAAVTMVASSAVVAGDAAKGEKGFNKCKVENEINFQIKNLLPLIFNISSFWLKLISSL